MALLAGWALLGACSDDDRGRPPLTSSSTTIAPASTPTTRRPFEALTEPVTAEDLPASWRPGCPVPVESLRRVTLVHRGFDGAAHQGVIVVHEDVAQEVVEVFQELYDAAYPVERMEPVDVYGGSDAASMDANNTSAFNCRPATGGAGWSEHAFGRAVDLNPLQNPYVRGDTVLPPQSARYLDRTSTDVGVIHDDDAAVRAFEARGWVWGGDWSSLKDYQHFSVTGR